MSTGDTGVRRQGLTLLPQCFLLCISSHTLGHICPFPLRRTRGNSDVRDIITVKIFKGVDCVPKQEIWGPSC